MYLKIFKKKGKCFFIFITLSFFLAPAFAFTEIVWKEARIPMEKAGTNGLESLLVWPNDAKKHPLVIINHGSPREALERAQMTALSSLPIAREFARRGWAVAVVLRRGYGTSGGGWAESYGTCQSTHYSQAADAASEDLHAAVKYLSTLKQFDVEHMLTIGVSAGGFASVAFTADNPPPGLLAAISFAGGRGSSEKDHVCQEDELISTFGLLGKKSRVPMLWVYAENDHFFDPTLAKKLFEAFTQNGGKATFVQAKPFGSEGHFLFSNVGIPQWTPLVDEFLKSQQLVFVDKLLPLPPVPNIVPPSNISAKGKNAFSLYLQAAPHKAFAISAKGAYGWSTGKHTLEEAKQKALDNCGKYSETACKIHTLDDQLIE